LGDVAQARTQCLQSKINLTTQKQNVENSFAQLAADLGLPANLRFKVAPLPDQIQADPMLESVDLLVCEAQNQRQDFLAAQADLRSKEASLLQAQRAPYPVFDTSLDVGKYWFDQSQHEKQCHWTAIVSVNMPLFQGFFFRNQIKDAEAKVDLARANLFQKEISIIQSVTTAHMGVKTAAQNLTDSEEYLKAAELEFNIAITTYKAGTATILDVLSAQSSLADARSKKAGAQQNWFTSLASIAYATGSLCAVPKEDCQ
jgi:outer membrane protein TolC